MDNAQFVEDLLDRITRRAEETPGVPIEWFIAAIHLRHNKLPWKDMRHYIQDGVYT